MLPPGGFRSLCGGLPKVQEFVHDVVATLPCSDVQCSSAPPIGLTPREPRIDARLGGLVKDTANEIEDVESCRNVEETSG
jgi:hypothetical protein